MLDLQGLISFRYVLWKCSQEFIGSALQGRDIVMHPGMGQSLVSLHSWVMWSSTIETFFSITGGSTLWGFIMLNTMCFQFNMLKICHPYDAIEKS